MGSGSSGSRGSSTVVSQPAPPQIAPQFSEFATQVGQGAIQNLQRFPLAPFSQPMPLQVPGLGELQRSALGQISNRSTYGIPTPVAEQQMYGLIPYNQQVSQSMIGLQPNELQALDAAGALPNLAGQSIGQDPYEQAGAASLGQFSSGDVGDSPAIRAAMARIASSVQPQVENTMAAAGLGRSGALGQELQSQMIGALLPVIQQGMQQQQSAGQQLAGLGTTLAGRRENALNRMTSAVQNTVIPTYMGAGQQEASRQADTINRMLATGQSAYNPLYQLGQSETQRGTQGINEALQGGALDRDVAGQIAQAQQADAQRRQALAEVFSTALLGQIPSFTTFPQTSTETYRTPGAAK